MIDGMGSFRIDIEIENNAAPGVRRALQNVLVDTGAELSCFPAGVLDELGVERRVRRLFRQADGSVLERWTGQASIYAAGAWTVDQIIFGLSGDLVLLGSRSLEGLNLRVDPVAKRLTDAGPMPLAIAHSLTLGMTRRGARDDRRSQVPGRSLRAKSGDGIDARRAPRRQHGS